VVDVTVPIVVGTPSSMVPITTRSHNSNGQSDIKLLVTVGQIQVYQDIHRYRFIKAFIDTGLSRHSQIQVHQDIIIKHIDRN
jgi:hypothetical protein